MTCIVDSFQPGGSLTGVFMNGSSYFECRLSAVAQRKASKGRESFISGGGPVSTPDSDREAGTARVKGYRGVSYPGLCHFTL